MNAANEPPPAHAVAPRASTGSWILAAALAAVLVITAVVGATPFGGWVQSFFFGTGTRWQEAYTAIDAAETSLPRNARERERLLLATAQAENDPPLGMPIGPRLHPPGTLARLRYETFDKHGNRLDEWRVRALVPTIGNGAGPAWNEGCPPACQQELARTGVTRLRRSGEAGLAEEWVLRMPVGRTFELAPRPLDTHDLLDEKPRRLGLTSLTVGGITVHRPAKIRVTLEAACAADVRVGTVMNLDMGASHLPLPQGYRTTRWIQLEGCGALERYPPPADGRPLQVVSDTPPSPDERPPRVAPNTPPPPSFAAIVAHREGGTGIARLKVDEDWLARHAAPVIFQVGNLCRYDAAAELWQRLPPPDLRVSTRILPQKPDEARLGARVAFELPRDTALFWVQWTEQNENNRSSRSIAQREALVAAGGMLCNDVHLGPAPAGRVAACVPFAHRAEARFVPDPATACAR